MERQHLKVLRNLVNKIINQTEDKFIKIAHKLLNSKYSVTLFLNSLEVYSLSKNNYKMLHSAIINKDTFDLYNFLNTEHKKLLDFNIDIESLKFTKNTQQYTSKYNSLLHLGLNEKEATVYTMKVLRYLPELYDKSVDEILQSKYNLLNRPCESAGFRIYNKHTRKPYLNTPDFIRQNKDIVDKELNSITEMFLERALEKLKDKL